MVTIVLGLGVSGIAVCNYLLKKSVPFIAVDDKYEDVLQRKQCAFLLPYLRQSTEVAALIHTAQRLIVSPGIPPSHPLLELACKNGVEVIGEIELACQEMQGHVPPMVGITGTNGKTTVTMLVTHMLQHSGITAQAVGNIGTPLLEVVTSKDTLVVELSSYQLETMRSKVFKAAVCLNITPDHLDYHKSMEEYTRAKLRLGLCVKEGAKFFVHEKIKALHACSYGFKESSNLWTDGQLIIRFGVKEAYLPKKLQQNFSHDTENFLAAYALARELGVLPHDCVNSYESFKKPPHRIEFVRTVNSVSYYDDSKGTNIDAVLRAVDAIPGSIILIAGGVHKGESYKIWSDAFKGRVLKIFAIGQAAPLIFNDLHQKIPVEICSTLQEAVQNAAKIARSGDTVLLSPGCSSFDMFKNYKDRGEQFQALVHQL